MEEQRSTSDSMLSSHLGRVINTLLASRPKKLEDAISRIASASDTSVSGSLEEPLCFLRKYVRDAVEKGEQFDHILIPMIESSLKSKGSKHWNQVLILLNWLIQDELIFEPLASNLAKIIVRKDDRYIALGWCNLIRALVHHETVSNSSSNTGRQEKHDVLLKIIFPSISHLSSIICSGSTLQGGFELPTRLAVAAADCILVLTETSTQKAGNSGISSVKTKSLDPDTANELVTSVATSVHEKKMKSTSSFSPGSDKLEMGYMLWEFLDDLVILVQRLLAWSRKSRPLHAKGLEQVLNWLQLINEHYGSAKNEAGRNIPKSGVLLLCSCWKHYSMLLRLEDHRFSQCYNEMLEQYISAIQFYMGEYTDEHSGNNDGGIETRKFFLCCMSLLLGRLDSKQFEITVSNHGQEIARVMLLQLQCSDEDIIEGAINILRATIFKANSSLTGSRLFDTQHMETLFPLLLNLLDERDSAARAVVLLTAEYCSMDSDGLCLQEVVKRLGSGNFLQRRNVLDVISELMRILSDSGNSLSLSTQQDMAKNLLDCLGDEESIIRIQVCNLLPTIAPSLLLPQLVNLVYNLNEKVRSSASEALVAVLKGHNQNPEVIVMLLDCLSQLCQSSDHSKTKGDESDGSKFDTEMILRLIPEWSRTVQDWNIFVEPLVEKMFAEPSNAIIVRFLSLISENLAEASDVVLHRVQLHMQRQKKIDDQLFSHGIIGTNRSDDTVKSNHSLFDRLCPLLIIRLLPSKIFDDLPSTVMYGQLCNKDAIYENKDLNDESSTCIATLLMTRAFHKSEFEDVRKLAAELCGRVHPQVLFPAVQSQLEHASRSRDILKMKACLFSVCTSLVLRSSVSSDFPVMLKIKEILDSVLLWPSADGDEVSKAQHGCIDCLALMICAELQSLEVSKQCSRNMLSISGEKSNGNDTVHPVLSCVIEKLTHDRNKLVHCVDQSQLISKTDSGWETTASVPLSFHMCMANVLISACQKISAPGKKPLAGKLVPVLIHSVKAITDTDIRAACIQVLFSAVYHLKSAILPHSLDLLKLCVKALRKGTHKEKMASVKLMASLMASEDAVVESISDALLEARSVLISISSTDPSPELQQVCQKLLVCMASPLDNFLHTISQ